MVFLAGFLLFADFGTTAHASETESVEATEATEAKDAHILGYWQRGEGEAIIEVRRDGDVYTGVIVSSDKRPETVGIEVFRDLRFNQEEGAWHGRAYSIKRKREVRIDIEVPKSDELELTAHILVFRRLVEFKRIPNEVAAGRQVAKR